MAEMILGLALFIGSHSVRVVAEPWRQQQIARLGEPVWKGGISVLALGGLVLAVYGYGLARADGTWLWVPPEWTAHAMALIMIPAFILLVAAFAPANRLRRSVGHPLVLAVGLWALAHLMANGRLEDLILFGAFLAWALVVFVAARRRDREAGRTFPEPRRAGDAVAVGGGLVAYIVFAVFLHVPITGVPAY